MFAAIHRKFLVPRARLRAVAGLALLSLVTLPARPLELQPHDPPQAAAGNSVPSDRMASQQTWRHSVAALDASDAL